VCRGFKSLLRYHRPPHRRVVVKARVVRHQGRTFRSAPLAAHVAYLERDGVTLDGEKAHMFNAEEDRADVAAFSKRCNDDRHHFRFIISPEDAAEMTDLKAFARDLAAQNAISEPGSIGSWSITGTRTIPTFVCWCAALPRAVPISSSPRDYISGGLRSRAEELVSIELGPRPEREVRSALEREVDAERWTRLDIAIRMAADETGFIDLRPDDPGADDPDVGRLAIGRLQRLERMGLAAAVGSGQCDWSAALE